MSLIRKHGAVLQAWACLDLVFKLGRAIQCHSKISFCLLLALSYRNSLWDFRSTWEL